MSEFERHPTIRWKVPFKADSVRGDIETENFQVERASYFMRCQNTSHEVLLHFDSGSEAYFRPACSGVHVHLESCLTGRIVPALTTAKKNPSPPCTLGHQRISEIQKADPDFDGSQLTFVVTFYVKQSDGRTDEKFVQTSLCVNPIPCYESLSEDLAKLLISGSNTDVEVQCEGLSMKLQRSVLEARSPVLAKMLQSQMVEGRTGVVKIEDIDQETLKLFVGYLYTGSLDQKQTFEAVMALYEAADKYEVKSLFRWCAQFLIENACDVLAVADAHSDEELFEKVAVFIAERKMLISDDGPWSAFSCNHPGLAVKVYSRFCKMICK